MATTANGDGGAADAGEELLSTLSVAPTEAYLGEEGRDGGAEEGWRRQEGMERNPRRGGARTPRLYGAPRRLCNGVNSLGLSATDGKKVRGGTASERRREASWDWAPMREGGGRWATPAREPAHEGGR